MSKKVIHYMPYTQRTANTVNTPSDRLTRSSVPTNLYQQEANTLPNHLAMRESFRNQVMQSKVPTKQSEITDRENILKNQRISKIQTQNKKLERMWLYLRDCNITGLGFNKDYYQKKKESIIGQPTTQVSSKKIVLTFYRSIARK